MKRDQEKEKEIERLHKRGWSIDQIFPRVGMSRSAVGRVVKRLRDAQRAAPVAVDVAGVDGEPLTVDEQRALLSAELRGAATLAADARARGDLATAASSARLVTALGAALRRLDQEARAEAEPQPWPPPWKSIDHERLEEIKQQAIGKLWGYLDREQRRQAEGLASLSVEDVAKWIEGQPDRDEATQRLLDLCSDDELQRLGERASRAELVERARAVLAATERFVETHPDLPTAADLRRQCDDMRGWLTELGVE